MKRQRTIIQRLYDKQCAVVKAAARTYQAERDFRKNPTPELRKKYLDLIQSTAAAITALHAFRKAKWPNGSTQ
jgi:hypothetical protein